jgi:hypothetical protein
MYFLLDLMKVFKRLGSLPAAQEILKVVQHLLRGIHVFINLSATLLIE